MAELTHEQKMEILDKWCENKATEEEIEMAGGNLELTMLLIDEEAEKPRGSRHIYNPGKTSMWVD